MNEIQRTCFETEWLVYCDNLYLFPLDANSSIFVANVQLKGNIQKNFACANIIVHDAVIYSQFSYWNEWNQMTINLARYYSARELQQYFLFWIKSFDATRIMMILMMLLLIVKILKVMYNVLRLYPIQLIQLYQ